MKKKYIILAIAAILTGGIIGTVAATHTDPPVPTTKRHAFVAPKVTKSEPTSANVTETTPVTTSKPAVVSTASTSTTQTNSPEDNRAQLQALITSTAAAHGISPQGVTIQWMCVDKVIKATIGYEDYEATVNAPISQVILVPNQNEDGTQSWRYFDSPGSCRIYNMPS